MNRIIGAKVCAFSQQPAYSQPSPCLSQGWLVELLGLQNAIAFCRPFWGRPALPVPLLPPPARVGFLSAPHLHGLGTFAAQLGVKGERFPPLQGAAERTSSSSPREYRRSKYFHLYFASFYFWQGVDIGVKLQLRRPCSGGKMQLGRTNSFCESWFSISVPFGKWASKSETFSFCFLMSAHSIVMILL